MTNVIINFPFSSFFHSLLMRNKIYVKIVQTLHFFPFLFLCERKHFGGSIRTEMANTRII